MKRIVFMCLGLLLIALVIFLGFKSTENTMFVLWFGIASALIAPIGLNFVTHSLNIKRNNLLQKLLKIPAIDELIQKAESQEEKLKILQEERKQISNIVRFETLKHAALDRKKHLEYEARQILDNLIVIDREINKIKLEESEKRFSNEIIDELYQRLENSSGDTTSKELLIVSIFDAVPVPFLSGAALLLFNMYKSIKKSVALSRTRKSATPADEDRSVQQG